MAVEFKWSKVKFNDFGLGIRESKCGRARIVKLNPPTGGAATFDEYLPILDAEILPRYWKLNEAKRALIAHANGQPLPGVGNPTLNTVYKNRGTNNADSQARYDATTKAFRDRIRNGGGASATPPAPVDSPRVVLGVSDTATLAECKSAYRKLCTKFHPDRNDGDEAAVERFKDVGAAWAELQATEAA